MGVRSRTFLPVYGPNGKPIPMTQLLHLDGSQGEGGGQILRTALSLSVLTGQPFHLDAIRARRQRPGLRPQHLAAVQAAARISGARVHGDRIGSQTLYFDPGPVRAGEYDVDVGTAGATSLVLQTLLLPLALAAGPSEIRIRGGTHVPGSPCFHYLAWHWQPFLARLGFPFALSMTMAGFYPQGGGELVACLPGGARPGALHLTARGELVAIRGLSAVANLPVEIAERQRRQALRGLRHLVDGPAPEIEVAELPATSRGTVLLVLAELTTGQACCFALGAPGKRAEQVADEAITALGAFLRSDGAVDPWLADQLLLPLALARGPSTLRTSEVTGHLLTQVAVIQRFLPVAITIDGPIGQAGTVEVRPGLGTPGPAPALCGEDPADSGIV